uniref:dUTPase domain-containing protein n=1 Tax=Anisakis simplex TaxID=6269 RepID=A0A0M3JFI0_ANISI
LKAFSIGDAVVELQHISIPHNESTFIPISVVPLHSIHLESETAIPFGDNGQYGSGLSVLNGQLPLGFRIALAVSFRDHAGRLFHATNARIKFRPHRYG